MTDYLTAYLADEKIGTLKSAGRDGLTFQYDPNWLAIGGPPLSANLPCREEVFGADKATAFFDNLLPESGIRASLARYYRVAETNTYELLRHLGGDCAGAITLLPGDEAPGDTAAYEPLTNDRLEQLLFSTTARPMAAGEQGIRLSLAGAQEKLPVCFDGETFSLPKGSAASTHIIKPPIRDIPQSVPNEAFCMRLAASSGLSVPDVQIHRGLSQPVYVIQRYDRRYRTDATYLRVPQEDFCQALGVLPDNKYEADGGPSLQDCFGLIDRQFTDPAGDTLALLDWVLFNLLTGNADAHAKNISMLRLPQQLRLAPIYDLLCTAVYPNLNARLAMKIGGQDRPDYLYSVHWDRFAEGIGIKRKLVVQRAEQLVENVLQNVGPVAAKLQLEPDELTMVGQISEVIDRRRGKLSALLDV